MRYSADVKLGVFGGRFDPPHIGHLLVAQRALEQLSLDEVWFVPAPTPPHKEAQVGAETRATLVTLATASHPQFRMSRIEIERSAAEPGPSYTFDTLTEIKKAYPETKLFFITGADAYQQIASWHRAEELVELAQMVALPRPGYDLAGVAPYFRDRVILLDTLSFDVSSTDIRRRLAHCQPIRYLVPELVESYLVKHDLYRK